MFVPQGTSSGVWERVVAVGEGSDLWFSNNALRTGANIWNARVKWHGNLGDHNVIAAIGDDELGSIEVRKRADLVILNQNLFDVSRYDVHKTEPVAVIMDGEVVYGEL